MSAEKYMINDAFFIDDEGNLIISTYIDLREHENRTPITTLIKVCKEQYAIEKCNTIRLSRPALFRECGEGLIRDPGEGHAEHKEVFLERVDDPQDMKETQEAFIQGITKDVDLSGSDINITIRTTGTKKSHHETNSITYGKEWWIFCTSIEPKGEENKRLWQASLDEQYNHTSKIYRPRAFAQALGAMVVEQLGPTENKGQMKHSFNNKEEFQTDHKFQWVFHGPVLYVENTYETIENISSKIGAPFAQMFVKNKKYQDQQEYRFVVLREKELSKDVLDLDVSLAMRGAMQERKKKRPANDDMNKLAAERPMATPSRETRSKVQVTLQKIEGTTSEDTEQSKMDGELGRLWDILRDPEFPIVPQEYNLTDRNWDMDSMMKSYAAMEALKHAVEKVEGKNKIQAASAAWHAESCIHDLCEEFENSIKAVCIKESRFVDICLNFPDGVECTGRISISPSGTYTIILKKPQNELLYKVGGFNGTRFLVLLIKKDLEEAGLRIRVAENPREK